MLQEDFREEIARLEGEIETFAGTIESCRKVILASKIAIAGGAIVLLVIITGFLRFEPGTFMAAVAALLGGTVLYGSNTSTSDQATAALKAAEARRAALIGEIDLTMVDDPQLDDGPGGSRPDNVRALPRLNGR